VSESTPIPGQPFGATPAWRAAVRAADGLCQCAGSCGRKHTASAGHCDQYQGLNEQILHLATDGRVYCPRCFAPIARSLAQHAADARAGAAQAQYAQGDLFALLKP
jgi:hypothetical protein